MGVSWSTWGRRGHNVGASEWDGGAGTGMRWSPSGREKSTDGGPSSGGGGEREKEENGLVPNEEAGGLGQKRPHS